MVPHVHSEHLALQQYRYELLLLCFMNAFGLENKNNYWLLREWKQRQERWGAVRVCLLPGQAFHGGSVVCRVRILAHGSSDAGEATQPSVWIAVSKRRRLS